MAEEQDIGKAAVTADVLSALLHPAMWRAFLGLDSAAERMAALDGRDAALRIMAKQFITRFVRHASKRQKEYLGRPELVHYALGAIARRTTSTRTRVIAKDEWVAAALEVPDVSRFVADVLFQEAKSGGLITEPQRAWVWRHPFVQSYLANPDDDQEEDT